MTSEQLQTTQNTLEELSKIEIDNPMTDYARVNRLLKVIKEIDKLRRETWNSEKFGECEEVAANTLKFCSDDIPF